MSTTTFPQEFPFEYTSNLSNQMLILVSESLGESGSGTGSAKSILLDPPNIYTGGHALPACSTAPV